ncbi:MAG: hypothetical protein A2539_01070 [Elusimicrobia bacterium RIFOXYD2_FULL_34_15]|nr:MAG: hypothetical protein A2539_01070 [Elusimicrobia bacterium RIFOXYD2_FULL_34_15]
MKIFEISNVTNYSGGAAQMIFLSEGLEKKNDFDITVVCQPDSEISKRVKTKKIELDMNSQIIASVRLAKIISKEKPGIVHCHHTKAHNIVLMASFLTKIPNIIMTRRVSFPIPKSPIYLYKYKTKKNRKLIAVSEKIKLNILDIGVEPSRVQVIHSGTDCNAFNPEISGEKIRQEFNIPKNAVVVCKISGYSHWKGFTYFLDACKKITESIDNVYFLLVGKDTDGDEISREVSKRSLERNVKMAGFRNDIPQIIAASNISVNVSVDGEGISGAIRESMAMEKPVIATDVGGNSEVVKNKENGILVEPKNSQSIADAVIYLIKNPSEAGKMGKKGRELIINNFSVDNMILKHEKLYSELA